MIVDSLRLPDDFSGSVRLFPLPDLVLFPRMVLPLHLFEPRYCEMLEEALESDQLITMATLLPEAAEPEKIADQVCIGRIVGHEQTAQGTHNILLAGVDRATIVREKPQYTLFRQADVAVLEDVPPVDLAQAELLAEQLIAGFTGDEKVVSRIREMIQTHGLSLSAITDLVAYYSQLGTEFNLLLLEESQPLQRALMILARMNRPKSRPFPPPFSMN